MPRKSLRRCQPFKSFAGTHSASPPLPRRSVETYRLRAAGWAAASPRTRRPAADRSLAVPSPCAGTVAATAEGTDPGPRVLGRRVKVIKGAIESGMISMKENLIRLLREGIISFETYYDTVAEVYQDN